MHANNTCLTCVSMSIPCVTMSIPCVTMSILCVYTIDSIISIVVILLVPLHNPCPACHNINLLYQSLIYFSFTFSLMWVTRDSNKPQAKWWQNLTTYIRIENV